MDARKENFSLKLRIYVLEDRLSRSADQTSDDIIREVKSPTATTSLTPSPSASPLSPRPYPLIP